MAEKTNVPEIRFAGFTDPWEQRKLGDCFEFLKNNTLSRADLNGENGTARNVHYGDILIKFGDCLDGERSDLPFITDDTVLPKFAGSILREGDVIFADTAEDEAVGKCVELQKLPKEPTISGLHTIPVRPRFPFGTGYLGHYLNSNAYHRQLLPLMQGIKVISVSKAALQDTQLRFPSLSEQSAIGAALSAIDNLITLHQRKYDKLCAVKKSMLDKMFPKPGETEPEIRFAGFTDPWEQRKLGELGVISTGNTPSTSCPDYYSDAGIPWVTPTDICESTQLVTDKSLSELGQTVARTVPSNSILCTCIASIGKNAITSTTSGFNQQINALVPDTNLYEPYFLYVQSSLWSETMKRNAAAGTMQIVNKREFSDLITSIPSKDEQYDIASLFFRLDSLITLHQRKLNLLKNTKKSLLDRMFV